MRAERSKVYQKGGLSQTSLILVCDEQSLQFVRGVLCVEGQPFNLLKKINLVLLKGLPIE